MQITSYIGHVNHQFKLVDNFCCKAAVSKIEILAVASKTGVRSDRQGLLIVFFTYTTRSVAE
jgi:hypothetical protein